MVKGFSDNEVKDDDQIKDSKKEKNIQQINIFLHIFFSS